MALGLPRIEKLRLIEVLWTDLQNQPDTMSSPAWHETVLKETEDRLKKGDEAIVDWSEAKRILSAK